jgi:hypothetical protein
MSLRIFCWSREYALNSGPLTSTSPMYSSPVFSANARRLSVAWRASCEERRSAPGCPHTARLGTGFGPLSGTPKYGRTDRPSLRRPRRWHPDDASGIPEGSAVRRHTQHSVQRKTCPIHQDHGIRASTLQGRMFIDPLVRPPMSPPGCVSIRLVD